ncbi:hypothetical protein L6452_36027 [Arctium lappa]|uniref:Uncharacterized protein n=1 Tax=Arctium lappa TaxID=4217 RepID=A0ACB8Y9G4_ARCLA|nr:hypothetical protein L6452_36027 [Arctium lappa]
MVARVFLLIKAIELMLSLFPSLFLSFCSLSLSLSTFYLYMLLLMSLFGRKLSSASAEISFVIIFTIMIKGYYFSMKLQLSGGI